MAYDDVGNLRTWLQITGSTYDGFLAQANDFLSDLTDEWSGRPSGSFRGTQSVSQVFYLEDAQNGIQVKYWPVTSVVSLTDDGDAVTDYDVFEKEGWIQFLSSSDSLPLNRYGRIEVTYNYGWTAPPSGVLAFIRRGTSYLMSRRNAEGLGADLIADTQITFRPSRELEDIFSETAAYYVLDI